MFTHAGHRSLQDADSWEQDFAVNQMSHRQVKEDGEALFTPPGAYVEPVQKTEVCWLGGKLVIAILPFKR
jgi:hypothetical protein